MAPPNALMRAYRPTLRDQAANVLLRMIGDSYPAQRFSRNLLGSSGLGGNGGAADFTPVGAAFQLDEAGRQVGGGNALAGAANAALAVVPIPAVAKVAKRAVKPAAKAATKTITAYHGSPHQFDQFSLDKIGTGEGAQAYGHGLYFAENEGVARGYRDQISGDGFLTPSGEVWSPDSLQHMNVRVAARAGDLDAAISRAKELLPNAPDTTRPMLESDLAALETLKQAGGVKPNPGSMYQVRINADPDHFLDWDAPLTREQVEQKFAAFPEVVKGDAWQRGFLGDDKGYTGRAAYAKAANWKQGSELSAPNAVEASQRLSEAGIPGIKYLDAGSRAKGDGSRNYVVFSDKIVEIMKRYGVTGPVAAAMLASGQYGEGGE